MLETSGKLRFRVFIDEFPSYRCPILHFDNVVRSLRGVANYSVYELMQPLSPEMSVELFRRLEELPSICQLLVIMHNNGYTWTSADKDSQEVKRIAHVLCALILVLYQSYEQIKSQN